MFDIHSSALSGNVLSDMFQAPVAAARESVEPARTPAGTAQIRASGLAVDFTNGGKRIRVLHDVNLEVQKGGFVSLIGPSGCGKSTLLKVLAGLLAPTEGVVSVAGVTPVEAVRQRRVGLVFQEAALMPWKNAIDNVCLLMEVTHKHRSRSEIRDRGMEMLKLVGLEHAALRMPSQLSGGMRQRVAIARALALDPEVLMMDEPFGALDAITREAMSDFLLEIWERTGKTIVFVTHSIDEAVFLSKEVYVMATNPARIIERLPIELPYPRNEASYSIKPFHDAATHLRRLLKEGHRNGSFA
ncbi:ABC transporter ATP-binding protein [uncultured Pigmentiphaga sp.]|uniref:ABC transporter ATP-binding protein n=1 Tax=uncultured Pigmentiphaga sp. TaxID=340361 RepID=UPI002633B643|nr:ABC transporter ATP-binding protein [uncultured Pigmentiphaga sp.]